MSVYFSKIPNFEYVSLLPDAKISDYITVKNLFKRGALEPDILENLALHTKYEIKGEKSYEELTQALNEYLNGDSTSEETKKEEKPTPVAAASTYNSQKTSDAFDDLFNN